METPQEPTTQTPTRGHQAAVAAATETILNCYLREGGTWRPLSAEQVPDLAEEGDAFIAVIPFPDERSAILAGVRYLSPTHRHRFRVPARIAMAGGTPWAVSLDTLMGMLADELGETHLGDELSGPASRGPDPTFLLSRIRQSVATVASFLDARDDDVDALWSAEPMSFIASEQALLLGHMAHPAAKSRWEMNAEQVGAYAPETEASFALRWLAVDPGIVEHDSATGTPAPELVERLLRDDPAVDGAALDAKLAELGARMLLPVHPWEFEHLRARAPVAGLIDEGLIVDLGELGSAVGPTSSVSTVYHGDWAWQLSFSLHVQLADEMRVAGPQELRRGVEAARALDSEPGARATEIAPGVVLLQDPAFLAVRHDGRPVPGLSVVLRENRWSTASDADVSALEVLLQDHPYGARSRLGQIVGRLAEQTGRPEDDIAREWFKRYADVVIVPFLRLELELGMHVATDQQSTLLELEGGWPARVVLRGAGGYVQRETAQAASAADVPGIGEAFADNALGVINALGVAGSIDETVLLGDLKALLVNERERGGSFGTGLLDRMLEDETWPVKARMRTRLHNDGDRFVRIPNPLHGVRD